MATRDKIALGQEPEPGTDGSLVKAPEPGTDGTLVKAPEPGTDGTLVKALEPGTDGSLVKAPVSGTQKSPGQGAQRGGKADSESVAQAEVCVYLGPNIYGLASKGAVFPGGIPEALAALAPAIEKYPLVEKLVVTGGQLPKARLDVKKPGNLLHSNYVRLDGQLKASEGAIK